MFRTGPLLLVALLCACSHSAPQASPDADAARANSAAPPPPAFADGGLGGIFGRAPPKIAGELKDHPLPRPGPGPVAPLSTLPRPQQPAPAIPTRGIEVSGCLANPRSASKYAIRSRAEMRKNTVSITPRGNAFVVTHSFTHACCLGLQTRRANRGDELVLHEQLTGKACRCVCASEIRFFVEGPTGKQLRVETEWPPGHTRTAYSGPLAPTR